jgi:hypothetical protein
VQVQYGWEESQRLGRSVMLQLPVTSIVANIVLQLLHYSMGLLSAQNLPTTLQQKNVWFQEFSRALLEMMGSHLLVVNSSDVEWILREILAATTYPFEECGLQFLAVERVQPLFCYSEVQGALARIPDFAVEEQEMSP